MKVGGKLRKRRDEMTGIYGSEARYAIGWTIRLAVGSIPPSPRIFLSMS
jgi:hypothetical protein